MTICPEYRVRLFLSVDLVGSTAFKAASVQNQKDVYPEWVNVFRQFYQNFPETLSASYRETKSSLSGDETLVNGGPKLWKTIGDEIVFCTRVVNLQHLACCITSFLSALHTYGIVLEASGHTLDVKGAGWIGIFPTENRSISLQRDDSGDISDSGFLTEDFELKVDKHPFKFDFLGTGIDAGFRIAKNASTDKFSASADLAFLLAKASLENMFSGRFTYHGWEEFKGVIQNHPYPVVSIDTERNANKRTVRDRERLLTREQEAAALPLHDFLLAFLQHEEMEVPSLPLNSADTTSILPSSYIRFRSVWEFGYKEITEREDSVKKSENPENEKGSQHLSPAVTQFAEQVSKEVLTSSMSRWIKDRKRQAELIQKLEKIREATAKLREEDNDEEQ